MELRKTFFNISNFNEFQQDIYLDVKNLSYYQEEPLDSNNTSLLFIMDLTFFLRGTRRKIKKRSKEIEKFKINERVEKIDNLKRSAKEKVKKVNIILSNNINIKTSLSEAAELYYG